MNCWLLKSRHEEARILGETISPNEGWFFVLGIALSEISVKDFSIKKAMHNPGDACPHCKEIMLGSPANLFFIGCGYCGYETEWVYAKYRITWRG